jgi:hypothetical protein
MRTLYIRHVPDEVAARLEKLAAQAGLPLSTFALQELTEAARSTPCRRCRSSGPAFWRHWPTVALS